MSREVALVSANGIGAKYRRGLDSGGGGSGYCRPVGRVPGGEGGYCRPVGRVPGGEGGYCRPVGRVPGYYGKTRRGFGRRFERKPWSGAVNGFVGGARSGWKSGPGGREDAGRAARLREGEERQEEEEEEPPRPGQSLVSPDRGEEEQTPWTLFKPPPAFPVDSSTARTLPRISYASKVKESLSRSSPQARVPLTSGEGHADDSSASEGSECEAWIAPDSDRGLGSIFHNQWGLSFITEPGNGRESSASHHRTELISEPSEPSDPSCPGGPSTLPSPVHRLSPNGEWWQGARRLDLQAVVLYFSTEWDQIWDRHRRDPTAVVLYEESLDGAGHTD
ncbi:uncharacterized protein si:ch211-214j24.10 [Heptranchias perlo]|uniref:uncharacterized protein si:ch211-214j24.10 n=1 Tax=Heptranchias perlo TaxID=212740 RepID=UPI003559A4CB